MKYLKDKRIIYPAIIIVLLIGLFSINSLYQSKEELSNKIAFVDEVENTTNENEFYVDIKGNVKKPGVYKVTDQMIVQDLVNLAGGLNKNAYTNNINLASKLKEGMVIYIFSKSEMTTKEMKNDNECKTEIIQYDNCIKEESSTTTNESSSLVNINSASKDTLMTLNGIGESKAIAIIEYRNINKFNKIEDIMNVSGIGESAFAQIKEYITV